jgi:hypothetical protein
LRFDLVLRMTSSMSCAAAEVCSEWCNITCGWVHALGWGEQEE